MLVGHSMRLQGGETRQSMLLYDVSFNLFWTFDLSGMPHVSYGKVAPRVSWLSSVLDSCSCPSSFYMCISCYTVSSSEQTTARSTAQGCSDGLLSWNVIEWKSYICRFVHMIFTSIRA